MKKFSSKRSIQQLSHLLNEYGIFDIVISPGSRNAPIAIQFAETDNLNCYSIVDERSAAFVALGMAKKTGKPVVATCTSGSAAANYYPAITEAFYQNVPLLLITADRPTDFVDLFDGQTIRQKNLFQQHSYGDFELLEDNKEEAESVNWEYIKKAIEICIEKSGPVHINIPLEEPLYEFVHELPYFPSVENTIPQKKAEISATLVAEFNTSKKILILAGTLPPNARLEAQLSQLVKNHSVVVLKEANSNLKNEKFFSHIDRYIFNFSEIDYHQFAPDLLITLGQNVVSKKVKQFLRGAKSTKHWHIDAYWQPDTYFSLTQKIETSPEDFFNGLLPKLSLEPQSYYNLWDGLRSKKDALHHQFCQKVDFSDFFTHKILSEKIPAQYNVHFSNSAAIRYAQLFDYNVEGIFCNRGTSGIDGSTSTAMGFAIKSETPTLLITGDLGFFYDINGLWNQYIPPFVRIIVVNNEEGNIFHIIPGPGNADPNIVEEFVATKHHRNAELVAKMFGFAYTKVDEDATLDRVLDHFFEPSNQPKILEINTAKSDNANVLKDYFEFLKGESSY